MKLVRGGKIGIDPGFFWHGNQKMACVLDAGCRQAAPIGVRWNRLGVRRSTGGNQIDRVNGG